MSPAPRIGSLGELLVEFVCTDRDGHNVRASCYSGPFPSGAPGIFIDQAARVGASAIFAGAVGDDAFGTVILDRLREAGVSDELINVVPGVPTGSAFVSYNSDGSRDFVFNIAHSAAAAFLQGERPLRVLREFRPAVFHVSGSTLGGPGMCSSALDVCRALHAEGVMISFDPNVRKELLRRADYLEAVQDLIALSAYFLPSEEDVGALFAGEPFEAFAPRLLQHEARCVVLRRGEQGCVGMDRSGRIEAVQGHRVPVVDPTGAGDCFCATFVTLMATGRFDLREALVRANGAGALSIGMIGPMEGNCGLDRIEAFLADHP